VGAGRNGHFHSGTKHRYQSDFEIELPADQWIQTALYVAASLIVWLGQAADPLA
jgi:hypothetical protein